MLAAILTLTQFGRRVGVREVTNGVLRLQGDGKGPCLDWQLPGKLVRLVVVLVV